MPPTAAEARRAADELAAAGAGAAVAVCSIAAEDLSVQAPEAAAITRALPIIERAADTLESGDLLTGGRSTP